MKVVAYSNLNARNKARVDIATRHFENQPKVAHHSAISTRIIKHVRSIVTVCDPSAEVQLLLGAGKFKLTQIALDK